MVIPFTGRLSVLFIISNVNDSGYTWLESRHIPDHLKHELLCTPETPTPAAPQYGASGCTETCGIWCPPRALQVQRSEFNTTNSKDPHIIWCKQRQETITWHKVNRYRVKRERRAGSATHRGPPQSGPHWWWRTWIHRLLPFALQQACSPSLQNIHKRTQPWTYFSKRKHWTGSQIALDYFPLPLDFSSDNKLPGPSWPIRCPR